MNVALRKPMTLGQFLAWEERQELRYEFDGFEPVGMTGGTDTNEAIGGTLCAILREKLRGNPCRVRGPTPKIEVAGRIRYPDAFVYCTQVPSNETVIREPVVVFEVLSPGTSRTDRIDRIERLREYQATGSIQRYVILEQDSIAATVFTRQGTDWIAHALTSRDTLHMPEVAVELPLSDIFADAGLSDENAAEQLEGSAIRELIPRDAEQGPVMCDHTIKSILWWICLVAAPAVLIAIELFHPAGFTANPGMYQFLSEPHVYQPHFDALDYFGPSWWFALHMIQTPLVGLVAVGLWLLVEPINRAAGTLPMILAWLSRAATLIFVIYYTALDAIGGIGLGRTIAIAQTLASSGQLDAQQLKGVILLLNTMWTDPWVGGVGSYISETGSWAAFAAPLFAALTWVLWRPRTWRPLIVLVAFGWELQTSHASPHGPIAFALLIVASVWLWFQHPNRDLTATA